MVKSKPLQSAEYVKEFISQRKNVATTRRKCENDLKQIIKDLTPKLKIEYDRGFKNAFKNFDRKMKLYDFLQLDAVSAITIVEGARITINSSKPPRSPRPDEILFSIDGSPIRI